jgi:3-(3-hydroxy-phenyl)propionate hydroxylase
VIAVGASGPVAGADLSLPDADGHFRLRYGVPASGAAYLLRPDQHVCALAQPGCPPPAGRPEPCLAR